MILKSKKSKDKASSISSSMRLRTPRFSFAFGVTLRKFAIGINWLVNKTEWQLKEISARPNSRLTSNLRMPSVRQKSCSNTTRHFTIKNNKIPQNNRADSPVKSLFRSKTNKLTLRAKTKASSNGGKDSLGSKLI